MTARHWMQIAALASTMGLTGTAVANSTGQATSTDDRSSVSSYGTDAPSSGAIVTPEDKALRMGQSNERAQGSNDAIDDDASTSNQDPSSINSGTANDDAVNPGTANDDAVNSGTANDDRLSINPGPSNDDDLSVNPGRSSDEGLGVNPARPDTDAARRFGLPGSTRDRDDSARPEDEDQAPLRRPGADMQRDDTGPHSMRGE